MAQVLAGYVSSQGKSPHSSPAVCSILLVPKKATAVSHKAASGGWNVSSSDAQ